MSDDVFIPPALELSVSRGSDFIVDFKQLIGGSYVAYTPGVDVRLEVDIRRGASRRIVATVIGTSTITDYHAVCKIESEVADTITDGSLWRAVVSYPTLPETTEVVPKNGVLKRYDGDQ